MKKLIFATVGACGLAAVAIGLATPALAADNAASTAVTTQSSASAPSSQSGEGTVALPPGGPVAIYPQLQSVGGANPYTPYGTNPYTPYGVWTP